MGVRSPELHPCLPCRHHESKHLSCHLLPSRSISRKLDFKQRSLELNWHSNMVTWPTEQHPCPENILKHQVAVFSVLLGIAAFCYTCALESACSLALSFPKSQMLPEVRCQTSSLCSSPYDFLTPEEVSRGPLHPSQLLPQPDFSIFSLGPNISWGIHAAKKYFQSGVLTQSIPQQHCWLLTSDRQGLGEFRTTRRIQDLRIICKHCV